MTALLSTEPVTEQRSWQSIRHQLFGQQRQREAEDRLITVFTAFQTKLNRATGGHVGSLRAPRVRRTTLSVLEDGANALLEWHWDQLQVATAAGNWDAPLPEVAAALLPKIQQRYPLFECARVQGIRLDCADVVESVGQLRGDESDAFFDEALMGLRTILSDISIWFAKDEPTAAAIESLRDAWDELLREVDSLACFVPGATTDDPPPATDDRRPTADDSSWQMGWVAPADVAPMGHEIELPSQEPETALVLFEPQAHEGLPARTTFPAFSMRFNRMELVAC